MMTLESAIKHYEEVAKEKSYDYQECIAVHDMEDAMACGKCAKEHRQLAEWLKELKQLRQQASWIPTSERQPEENGNYLAFYRSDDETAAFEFMMIDHCSAGGGWLHEVIGKKLHRKAVAWMPLPKAYKVVKKCCSDCKHHTNGEIHGVTPCGSCGDDKKNFEQK